LSINVPILPFCPFCHGHKHFDVFGPVVNLACRLESETKGCDDDVIIQDEIYNALRPPKKQLFKDIGIKEIRGFQSSIQLYSADSKTAPVCIDPSLIS